jgi:class 3 adenylate cyclase
MNAAQQNALLAILFADISGSTALYEKLGNEIALQVITRTLKTLVREMAEHHGTLVKTIGDEIMCTFPTVTDAIRAASAMQTAIEEQPTVGDRPVYVRIGVHFGEVILDGRDVFGDAVNVAARIAGITRARQVLTSQTVVDLLPETLREKARPVMRAELKGKEEAMSVFQIIWEKDDTMSTRIGMSAFRKPNEGQAPHKLLLRYHQQVLTLSEQLKSALLGRGDTCDLVIQNNLASRQHARIEYSLGKFLLTDHSSNGTFIRFADNQIIHVSRQQIVLHGSGTISPGQSFSESPTEVIEYILQ